MQIRGLNSVYFYRIGAGIAFLGIIQFLAFLGLDKIGWIDIGNGLGPGLMMWLCWAVGGLVLGVGLLLDLVRRVRSKRARLKAKA